MKPTDLNSGLTHARLRELLHYDPSTGQFVWRVTRGRAKAGSRAGYLNPERKRDKRRFTTHLNGRHYEHSRLAWFYMTGTWPADEIDHRDRNAMNDRWENLRAVDRQTNEVNKGPYRNNKLGIKGVRLNHGRPEASIRRDGKRVFLGTFASVEQAGAAYHLADGLLKIPGALRG